MCLRELKNLKTGEVSVYYRMEYNAVAVYEILGYDIDVPVSFKLEINPLGGKEIFVCFLSDVAYPLVPLVKVLKKKILELYDRGVIGS